MVKWLTLMDLAVLIQLFTYAEMIGKDVEIVMNDFIKEKLKEVKDAMTIHEFAEFAKLQNEVIRDFIEVIKEEKDGTDDRC